MSARDVQPHEELCIYYGHNLWFPATQSASANDAIVEVDDGWGGLTAWGVEKGCHSVEVRDCRWVGWTHILGSGKRMTVS